jgi:DNA-binding transcriptional MerR regulator
MSTHHAQYKLAPNFEKIKNVQRFFGLLSLRELSFASGVAESTLRVFYKRKWITPILISNGQSKSLFSPATSIIVDKIQGLKKNGFNNKKLVQLIAREFKTQER